MDLARPRDIHISAQIFWLKIGVAAQIFFALFKLYRFMGVGLKAKLVWCMVKRPESKPDLVKKVV